MIAGLTTAVYTSVHVLVSLVGIGCGFVVLIGMIGGKRLDGWTALFLATTVATSLSGFGFPAEHLLPSHVVGAVSLLVLAVGILARYPFHMEGAWRRVYVVCAALALYLNVFVLVVQAFLKVAPLKALAPNQMEPPFVASQLVVLALFLVLSVLAATRFREGAARARS